VADRTITAAFPAYVRKDLEPVLPPYVKAAWFNDVPEALTMAQDAEIGWFDIPRAQQVYEVAVNMRWLFTLAAGVEHLPLSLLRDRHVRVSNGVGLNAANVADYAVMGILVAAKRFAEVIRAHDRREWLEAAPGRTEMRGTRALIIGYGSIGAAIGERLAVFGVSVTGVRSKADPARGMLGPNDWQQRIGEFDWIVVGAPATSETKALIGRTEIAAMKPTAWLINIARGSLIDSDALREALAARKIGGAFLDVTDPEPLPADDSLWGMPETLITMHLSGRSETGLVPRAVQLFLSNLERYRKGESLENEVDLKRGY